MLDYFITKNIRNNNAVHKRKCNVSVCTDKTGQESTNHHLLRYLDVQLQILLESMSVNQLHAQSCLQILTVIQQKTLLPQTSAVNVFCLRVRLVHMQICVDVFGTVVQSSMSCKKQRDIEFFYNSHTASL